MSNRIAALNLFILPAYHHILLKFTDLPADFSTS